MTLLKKAFSLVSKFFEEILPFDQIRGNEPEDYPTSYSFSNNDALEGNQNASRSQVSKFTLN